MRVVFLIVLHITFLLSAYTGLAQVRMKIDEERKGVDYLDKRGLELSEKFKRMDKNYYIGHMYEGAYKYNRATDYLGYKNAIKPLLEAKRLIEKDYNYKLKTRTSDVMTYLQVYQYHQDYSKIADLLYECYSNIEQAEDAMKILQEVKAKRMQVDFYCAPNIQMSWLYHRNRYHTSKKYSFLKNSIEENEQMAIRCLEDEVRNIQKNYPLNSSIFPSGFDQQQMWSVYFNKTLIYSYNFEMDSAEYYYDLLKGTPAFNSNNYAYTKLMNGEFKEAIHFFDIEKKHEDFSRKNTKEFYYMLALLSTYRGKPQDGIKDLQDIIARLGSTPGFGWNNLGLARGYYYNGQLFESQKHQEKSANFEELHIGTTWAPEQYDFTNNLFSYLNKDRKLQSIPFENKNYWYNIPTLAKMGGFFVDEQTDKFLLINKFGANPERDYVYYHIFSPENLISFDETWQIIDGLDADFFIKKFTEYLKDDPRDNMKRYYRYFIGRLLINKGEYEKAETMLINVVNDTELDHDYEKLLLARCHEALCVVYDHLNVTAEYNNHLLAFYSLYPQLVPFSKNTMTFNLDVQGSVDSPDVKKILEELYSCKINFLSAENRDPQFPVAEVRFTKIDSLWQINCRVTDREGEVISSLESFRVDEIKGSGKRLSYYLFNIPATTIPDYGENNYWLIAGILLAIAILWTANRVKRSMKF
ncbi:MAG TPA: hypothetical protein VNB90_13280 [Cytophagaceae bacterium]|nr:hypothetical protein [Cytophagaceae bacterium]